MIVSCGDRLWTVKRRTAILLAATTPAASMTLTTQPSSPSCLSVNVQGTPATGTVTVTGTVDGVPGVVEVVTFTGPRKRLTTKRFSAVSGIATSGLANETGTTIAISAAGPDGSPQNVEITVATGIPGVLKPLRNTWPSPVQGSQVMADARIMLGWDETYTPRPGDYVVDDALGDTYTVQGVDVVQRGVLYASGWLLDVKQVDTSASC
jgi:hypothetical protein